MSEVPVIPVTRTVVTVEFDHHPGQTPDNLQSLIHDKLQEIPGHVATEVNYQRQLLVRSPLSPEGGTEE